MTFNPRAKPAARQEAVARLIAELNADTRPILLGPWRSELGFEATYWTPFLRFFASKVKKFSERASVVTRGGLAPLYRDVAHQGYDLYALRDVKDVRRENLYDQQVRQKGQTVKQLLPTDWDDAVLEDAAKALGITGLYHTVHPAWMYWALSPFWDEDASLKYLLSLTNYAPLPKLEIAGELPPKYVAVKFYARPTFPYPHPQIAAFVQQTVASIASRIPVVVLNAGSAHDDHIDIGLSGPNIFCLPPDLEPEKNLEVQAAVLGHARAFVGTYGGVAQLALRLGIPSCSFYGQWLGTSHAHYALNSWLSKTQNVLFSVGSLPDADMWRQVVGPATVPQGVADAA